MDELMNKAEGKVAALGKRGVVAEFKEFINRGNVVDLAVAFVMGAAFKTVVDSFAGNAEQPGILGGFIGAIFGGKQPDFSKKMVTINGSEIPLGAFATASLNFFFVALALFLVVKFYNKFRATDDDDATVTAITSNDLLAEIRDEIKAMRSSAPD
jgi:large conductance mechanosensitive channel